MLDQLLLNVCVLVTGVYAVSATYATVTRAERWSRLIVRFALMVFTALELMTHALVLAPGLMFDLRTVLVGLASRRHGVLAGLLVALPLAVFRWSLGGAGVPAAELNLLLVALLASRTWWTRTPRPPAPNHLAFWWWAVRTYVLADLAFFWAFHLTGRPVLDALPVYLLAAPLSALGALTGHQVIHARLRALQRAERLEVLAFRDALTGLHNRRQFDEDLQRAAPTSHLLLLDLDHFKRVNDTHGHAVGDQVLSITAGVIRASVRPSDGVYRLGGEEFAVLMHHCKPAWAMVVAERVRMSVGREVAHVSRLPSVTISGGLTMLGADGQETMRVADMHLYQAKEGGRNQVRGAGAPDDPKEQLSRSGT